ncbi:11724_t:CDS:1, partial [Paraglomus brasilianum]
SQYRKLLCENRINAFDESVATGQEMSQLDIMTAIQFTADAWARVQQSTITRSWNKTGILPRSLPEVQCNENDEQTIQHLIDCLQVEEP